MSISKIKIKNIDDYKDYLNNYLISDIVNLINEYYEKLITKYFPEYLNW